MEIPVATEMLAETLRNRMAEFGPRPAYVLFPEELAAGAAQRLLQLHTPEDRGDGTMITQAIFEGHVFLCVTETEKR